MSLKIKNILFGYFTSSLGSWIDFIAILTLSAYQFDASSYDMAIISASSLLPGIILTKKLGQLLGSNSVILALRLSLFCRVGATIGIILSPSIEVFIIFVALRSVFNSFMQPAINVLSFKLLKKEYTTQFYSMMNIINNITKLIIPMLGAAISSVIGEKYILVMSVFFTSLSLLSFMTLNINLKEINNNEEKLQNELNSRKKSDSMLPFLWCVATYFSCVFLLNNQMAFILKQLHFDKSALGILISCSAAGNILSSILTAKLSSIFHLTGRLLELIIPGTITAIGFGLMSLILFLPQPIIFCMLLLIFFCIGIFSARFSVASNVFIFTHFSQVSGIISARLQSVQNMCILISPFVGAYILNVTNPKTLFFISSVFGFVSFLSIYIYCRRNRYNL